jgi:hypothetical protein
MARSVLSWDNGMNASLGAAWRVEDLRTPLQLPAATDVPTGRYAFGRLEASIESPSGRIAEMEVDGGLSAHYGGRRADLDVEASWNPSRFFGLSLTYGFDAVRFPERAQGFDAHVGRLRLRSALNTHASGQAFIQYNSAARQATANVRLRYHVRTGTDLWLVYSETLDTAPGAEAPLRSRRRTVLLKATYTFGL